MGRSMGFEPTDAGATIRCVDRFATIAIWLTGVVGLEPTLTVLETAVLPIELYPYMKVVEGGRFELPNPMGADLQSAAFSHFATDRKSTRLNSSHVAVSYAVFCLKKQRSDRDGQK